MKRNTISLVLFCLFVIFLLAGGCRKHKKQANTILKKTGIKGGIIAHLGVETGQLTVGLHADSACLVHALSSDQNNVETAREYIKKKGLYGSVSAEMFDGRHLPYGDNIVNLMVVDDVFRVSGEEIERVLVPGGIALVRSNSSLLDSSTLQKNQQFSRWTAYKKPWPDTIGEWTHYLNNATGNMVTDDKLVGISQHLQWHAGPTYSRHHDALASMSAMTSSGGRVFYIYDEGAISLIHRPPDWKLIARDAFNGKLLWKRDIPTWMTHLYNFRAGPKQLPRRLVTVGEHVYVTLGWTAPISKLDAATGETLNTYRGSEGAEELVFHNGVLMAVINEPSVLIEMADGAHGYWELAEQQEPTAEKSIIAYDAASGKKLWRKSGENLKTLSPLSLCARGDRAFYHDGRKLHCINVQNGKQQWTAPFNTEGWFIRSYAPTIVAHEDVLLCLKWDRSCGYSIEAGEKLWENKGSIGFGAPGDLFVTGDTVWTFPMRKSIWRKSKRNEDGYITTGIDIPKSNFLNQAKTGVGLDVHTGEIIKEMPFAHPQHHHRCYRNKASESSIFIGHSGVQVLDLESGERDVNKWVRGICQYGIMPANGYLYVPPDPCQCYQREKINGFFALSKENSIDNIDIEPVLEKGPVYSQIQAKKDTESVLENVTGRKTPVTYGNSREWPTYRANISRSASTDSEIPANLEVKWQVDVGDNLTAPVVAKEKVYLADEKAYSLFCLDAHSGQRNWTYLANGPIDSPPTIYKGLVIFGCGDGSVYCLDANSGDLAWRFKVSRHERRIGLDNRMASPWSVHGSVLVQNNTVYFAAGRSSHLDGGIRLYGLNVWTGEVLHQRLVSSDSRNNEKGIDGLSDILISDGERMNMRQLHFDKKLQITNGEGTIIPSTGLLDKSWFHRQEWRISRKYGRGQLIVYDGDYCCAVRNPYTGLKQRRKGQYEKYNQVGHFHQKFSRYEEDFFPVGAKIQTAVSSEKGSSWNRNDKFQPRAMVLAGEKLFLAGWEDSVSIKMKSGRPKDAENPEPKEPVLRVYSAARGKVLAKYRISGSPVFDGMATAYNSLFVSLKNGKLLCLGEENT